MSSQLSERLPQRVFAGSRRRAGGALENKKSGGPAAYDRLLQRPRCRRSGRKRETSAPKRRWGGVLEGGKGHRPERKHFGT